MAQAYIDKEFPRHIFLETTSACNLKCEYCPREQRSNHLDFNLFRKIIDECGHYGPRSFSLHLFGEPLLYPSIIEAIRYIKAKNKRHTVLLTTNGTLLNKFADELVAVGVDKIIWSWRRNNFTPRTIEVLKRIGLIRLLIEETPKEEFEVWSKFPEVEIKHLHNYGGNIDTSKWHNEKVPARHPCYHLWLAPAIRWNGEIVECCNLPESGKDVLGIYGETTLAKVWAGPKLKALRDAHLSGVYPGVCNGCNSWQAYPSMHFPWQLHSRS